MCRKPVGLGAKRVITPEMRRGCGKLVYRSTPMRERLFFDDLTLAGGAIGLGVEID